MIMFLSKALVVYIAIDTWPDQGQGIINPQATSVMYTKHQLVWCSYT